MKPTNSLIAALCAILLPVPNGRADSWNTSALEQVASARNIRWYGDREWNVSLWGTYAFTRSEYPSLAMLFGATDTDAYLQADHAWGVGLDAKYFFHRHFGVGLSASRLSVRQSFPDVYIDYFDFGPGSGNFERTSHEGRAIGSLIGSFTLRYPVGASRWSPYAFAGVGVIFGGGQRISIGGSGDAAWTVRSGDVTEPIGQFGGGIEVRVTRHAGVISDFAWHVVSGENNDFGLIRTGLNISF